MFYIYIYILLFLFRYGKGFGLLHYVVGSNHWLNQPNSVFGLAFYTLMAFLCKYYGKANMMSSVNIVSVYMYGSNLYNLNIDGIHVTVNLYNQVLNMYIT